ncbi:MAG: hypothetical protein JRI68_27715 [Deltaproteobacteria bacterium]|nr:hypothetical protein [Deltaproteobacteria bacterium]
MGDKQENTEQPASLESDAMQDLQPDQLSDGDEDFVYRDGNWTTTAGYCVNTARAHVLTLKFYARHGRPPTAPERVKPKRVTPKAARAKTAAVRAAVAKALAAQSGKRAAKKTTAKKITAKSATKSPVKRTRPKA